MFFRLMFLLVLFATSLNAQNRRPSHCIAIADAAPGLNFVHRASYSETLEQYTVRISFVDHSMFLIQSPGGTSVATDFTGYLGATSFLPSVVTMNYAHSSHWTAFVHPDIPYALNGWGPYGEGIEHHLELNDMLVRNVSTDIRSFNGTEKNGNSIFIFEVEGLCIGHLGHLHHEPNEEQYAAIGRLDVVLAAVDGSTSIDLPTMSRIVRRLKSSIVIPMHWFGRGTLEVFLADISDEFDVQREGINSLEVSLRTLPSRPTIVVLEPKLLE